MTPIRSTIAAFAFAAILSPSFAEETKEEAPKTEPAKEAPAKAKPKHDPAKVFKKKDADSDGFLSKEEFSKGAKDAAKAGTAFDRKDKDKDGKLSLQEFTAKPQAKGKPKKQK
jgi:Ca2+-binding EF-hand superfamily protein